MKSKYLTFEDVTPDDRKTVIHEIYNYMTSDDVGRVLWYGGWRKYVWEIGDWRFDAQCLRDLADHIDMLMEARKKSKLKDDSGLAEKNDTLLKVEK